jgi:hypothetical protein
MRPRTLLVLLALVVGIGAFVYFYERELPSSDERAERAKRVLPGLAAEAVTGIEIEGSTGRLRLEREAAPAGEADTLSGWRLVEPLVARADRALVEELLTTLAGLTRERTLTGVEPAEVGLDAPRFRLRLTMPAGERVLAVGAAVPVSGDVVVAEGESGVPLVAPAAFVADLERPAAQWRARDLFPGRREAISRLELSGPAGRTELEREGEAWRLVAPVADRADRELVGGLLADLTGLRAEAFLDDEAANEARVNGEIVAHLDGREGPFPVVVADAAAESGHLRARVAGEWVELATANLAAAVARAPGAWRSRAWSAFDSWQVDAVTITDAAGATRLVRHDGQWQRDGEAIDYGSAGDLLYQLAGVRAERLAESGEEAALTAGEPVLTFELTGPGGATERLLLYPERDGLRPARTEGRAAVLLLPAAAVADLEAKVAAVRTAPIANPVAPAPAENPSEP